jgi:hypothetical protein
MQEEQNKTSSDEADEADEDEDDHTKNEERRGGGKKRKSKEDCEFWDEDKDRVEERFKHVWDGLFQKEKNAIDGKTWASKLKASYNAFQNGSWEGVPDENRFLSLECAWNDGTLATELKSWVQEWVAADSVESRKWAASYT